MKHSQVGFSRRDLLAGAGLASAMHAGAAAPARSAPSSPVAIAKVAGYDEDLVAQFEKMFDQIGGIGNQVKNKTVGMKLNLTGYGGGFEGYSAGQTSHVHPNVAIALATVLGKLGARRIRVLESAGRKEGAALEDKLLKVGWDLSRIKNAAPVVEFEDTNGLGQARKYSVLRVKGHPYVFPAFALNHSYEDCDFFISVGKMKNHEEMGVTLSMKNLFGITPELIYGTDPVPPGVARPVRERVFHYGQVQAPAGLPQELDPKSNRYEGWRLPRILTDICAARPIDLAVLDGIETLIGGEGALPGAKPGKPHLLVVGRNCVCTDAVAIAAMGYNPRAGRHEAPFRVYKSPRTHPPEQLIPAGENFQYADNIVLLAEAVGMGTADLSKIDVRGVPIKDAVYDFEARWKGQEKI